MKRSDASDVKSEPCVGTYTVGAMLDLGSYGQRAGNSALEPPPRQGTYPSTHKNDDVVELCAWESDGPMGGRRCD